MYQIRIAVAAALALSPVLSYAAPTSVEARLEALEQRQNLLERQLAERDARIRELESQVQAPNAGAATRLRPSCPPLSRRRLRQAARQHSR